jgi:hypothetical protein
MHKYRLLTFVLASLLSIVACDIIEPPYLENQTQLPSDQQCIEDAAALEPFPSGQPIARKVFLEEITGHTCGNCPEESEKAFDFYTNQYPGQMVLMYVHAGFYAKTETGDKFTTDFTSEDSEEIDAYFNGIGYPFGMVDRILSNPGNAELWGNYVNQRLQMPAEAGIRIFNCYDPDSAKLTTVVDVKYVADATDQEYLTVYLVEDKVKDWQKDYRYSPPDIPDYTHHNVFRAAINGLWGKPLTTETVQDGDQFTFSASYDIPAEYAVENCKVVAFVSRFDTKEVRQVEEAPIIQ